VVRTSTPVNDSHISQVLGLSFDQSAIENSPFSTIKLTEPLVGTPQMLECDYDGLNESPPSFIPAPPPISTPTSSIHSSGEGFIPKRPRNSQMTKPSRYVHGTGHRTGVDVLTERLNAKYKSPDDVPISNFVHDKRNIWAMYDRPFDEGKNEYSCFHVETEILGINSLVYCIQCILLICDVNNVNYVFIVCTQTSSRTAGAKPIPVGPKKILWI